MLSIDAKLSSHLLVSDRVSGSKHSRDWVYVSKIENSSKLPSRTVSMPERIEALS